MEKILNAIENHVITLSEDLNALKKENVQLKTSSSVDNLLTTGAINVTEVKQSLEDSKMEQTLSLIQNLQSDNARLTKKNTELEERLKVFDRNVGEKIFLDQIKVLEKRSSDMRVEFEAEKTEMEERIRNLSLQILERNEQIKDLEQLMKEGNQGNVIGIDDEI